MNFGVLAKGAGLVAGLGVAERLCGLGIAVLLARGLSPSDYGIYAFTLATVVLLTLPFERGIAQLAVREVAQRKAAGDGAGIWAFARWSARAAAIGMCATGCILLIMAALLPKWVEAAAPSALLLGLLVGATTVPLGVAAGLLRGLGWPRLAKVPSALGRPGLFLVLLFVLPWASPAAALALHGAAAGVAAVWVALALWRRMPPAAPSAHAPKTWRAALPALTGMAAMAVILRQTDVLMLGLLRDATETGLYVVAAQMGGVAFLVKQSVNHIVAGPMAETVTRDDPEALRTMAHRAALLSTFGALGVTLAMLVLGPWLLATVFGPAYAASWPALVILCGVTVIDAAIGPSAAVLVSRGQERSVFRTMAVAALLNVVLNLALVPVFGLVGAACATGMSLLFAAIAKRREVSRHLNFDCSLLGKWRGPR